MICFQADPIERKNMPAYQKTKAKAAVSQASSPPSAPSGGLLQKWTRYLQEPIDGASLAIFRICFGLVMVAHVCENYAHIERNYISPHFNFSFISGLHTLPGFGMYELFAVMGTAALCIALGVWCRPAALVFCLGQTYLLLVEKSYYQNHYYLICLLSFLLILIPSNRVWSIDNMAGKLPRCVPRWSLLILKAQIFIVYFYGGVAKLNVDWLRGEPITTNMQAIPSQALFGFGQYLHQHWFSQLIMLGGIAVDFSIGFLLWCPATFWLGAAMAVAFHVLNSVLFPVGVFPWVMIATIGLFAAPDWPRRIVQAISANKLFKRNGAKKAAGERKAVSAKESDIDTIRTNEGLRWKTTAILVFAHLYLIAQILMPLRHWLYPGEVSWTEQGHRFSWQMMLRTKRVKAFDFIVINPATQQLISINIQRALNARQMEHMCKRPDMILQFAHYIADRYQKEVGVRPIVKVRAIESLNYRQPQYLIDPNVDLAAQTESLMPAPWIVPLNPLIAGQKGIPESPLTAPVQQPDQE